MNKAMLHKNKALLVFITIGLCCALLLALLYQITSPVIQQNRQDAVTLRMRQLVKNIDYDNHPFEHPIMIKSPDYLGTTKKMPLYILRKNNHPVAFIFNAIAPNGYNGDIYLAAAISPEGQVLGVKITQHKETPGLGDYFEKKDPQWVSQFHHKDSSFMWRPKKENGDFDAWTGATITSAAIISQVGRITEYYALHQQELMHEP